MEPVSLAEARDHLRVDSTDEDALLLGLIATARTHVENATGRALITQTWRLSLDGWPGGGWFSREGWAVESSSGVRIPKPPVQDIVSVECLAADDSFAALDPASYRLAGADTAPLLLFSGGWPASQAGADSVRITFTAGYGDMPLDVPAPLRHAVLLMVAHFHANREAVVPQVMTPVPLSFDALLSTYRINLP